MIENGYKKKAEQILAKAGIKINGSNSWDIQVHNENIYRRVFSQGALGLGESYMDGWWDVKNLDEFFTKIFSSEAQNSVEKSFSNILLILRAKISNLQGMGRAKEVGKKHYDIGNEIYKEMLDKRMIYSCGYWKNAKTLDESQEDKLELICKKLKLKKGMKVLDIGCGWGGFAKYATERYGVKVVGITISKEQAKLAKENVKGLPIEIRIQDYRDVNEKFDVIVSIGMFEHVGYKNYRTYFKKVSELLNDGGITLLHTIGRNKSVHMGDPWTHKYIFPNGMLPSPSQIANAFEGLLVLEDWHNFSLDYDKTLMEWYKNFKNAWPMLKKKYPNKYDNRFYRMWEFYLMISAGGFRGRHHRLWQIVLTKKYKKSYESVR